MKKQYYIKPEERVVELEMKNNCMVTTSEPIYSDDDPYATGSQTDAPEYIDIKLPNLNLPNF